MHTDKPVGGNGQVRGGKNEIPALPFTNQKSGMPHLHIGPASRAAVKRDQIRLQPRDQYAICSLGLMMNPHFAASWALGKRQSFRSSRVPMSSTFYMEPAA